MSHSDIAHFPNSAVRPNDNDPDAAASARERIATLPDAYIARAAPHKENLVGAIHPVSPAAEKDARPVALATLAARSKVVPILPATPAAEATAPIGAPVNPLESASPAAATPRPEVHEPVTAEPQRKYRVPSPVRPIVTAIGIFVLLLVAFKAPILLSQLSYLTHSKAAAVPATTAAATTVPTTPTISIPKINVSAPISFPTTTADAPNYDPELENGVVHLPDTALPGQVGNTVIFGHSSNDWWEPGNYKFVFVLLDKLVVGDTFTLDYNSQQYIYQVTSTEIVEPTDVSIVSPTADAEATVFTCTPPGTSWKRFVIHAKQISPAPSTAQAATKLKSTAGGTLPSNAPSLTDDVSTWWNHVVSAFGFKKNTAGSSAGSGAGDATPATLPAQ